MAIPVGTRLGPYEILSQLGKGDIGEVYLARDIRLDRRVALKILPESFAEDGMQMLRFSREAIAASALNHTNIIAIYEVGTQHGVHFVATEFIEGETLGQRMLRDPPTIFEAMDIVAQVASALSEAHAHGIIHRDIKPDNIMLGRDSTVKVLDFGLAKFTHWDPYKANQDLATEAIDQTDPGTMLGTAAYMSPEQAKAEPLDARADLWSLGAVLYELITGHPPFEGASQVETIYQVLHKQPPPITRYAHDVPRELERLVTKALTKDPEGRYQTAEQFRADLQGIRKSLGPPVTNLGTYLKTTHPLERFLQSKLLFAMVGVVLLAVVVLALLYFNQPRKPNRDAVLRLQIGQATQTAQSAMQESFSAIEPVVVELARGKASTGYDASEVIYAVRTGEIKLTQGLASSELDGLREYVLQLYPVPKAEALEEMTNQHGRLIVTEHSKNSAFANASEFISRIRRLSEQGRLSIDLKVNSEPDQASYDMWSIGGSHRTTTTNNTVDNVWRGMYNYRVTKAGFKSIEESLNLVDSDGRTLDCHFYGVDEQDGPHPCKLR